MYVTLTILLVATAFFMSGKVRLDFVALSALTLLMLTGILTPVEALSGFSNSIVIMLVGLFVVGGAIFRTGLANVISKKILSLAGNSQTKMFVLVMLATWGLGGFMSNTGTVALMLPIVASLAMAVGANANRFLMPMAFASGMSGMICLIGTPPNLIIDNTLREAGYEGLAFFSFLPIGLICITIGIILLGPLSKKFLAKEKRRGDDKKTKSFKDLANEYQLSHNLFRVKVTSDSATIGKTLHELEVQHRYGINVLEIRRRSKSNHVFLTSVNQKLAGPETEVLENDIVYLLGTFPNVRAFASENNVELIDMHQSEEEAPVFGGKLRFDQIGIAEVVLLSNSRLVNQTIENSGFRENYRVNILGIHRQKRYILHDLNEKKMESGDVLLVQGAWNDIARLTQESSEWVVMGQPLVEASKLPLNRKAPIAAFIMVTMVLLMVFNVLPAVVAVMMAAVGMVLTGCFRNVEEAYKTINWECVVLIGAMLPMSVAIEKTGIDAVICSGLVNGMGNFGPMALLVGIYFTASLLTLFISNTATAVLFAPIALHCAQSIGVSPYPFLLAVTVAASMCFASPFSTPPNALVMSAGRYTFMDYIKVGLPLQIILGIVMVIVIPLLWPF